MEYLGFINNWSLILGSFFCLVCLILFLYVITFLRRKFDPLFKDVRGWKEQPGLFLPFSSPIVRGINYAGCIAYPTLIGKKKKYLFTLYKGYNFRKDCNIIQIILAWIFINSSALAMFLGVVIHIPLSWFLGIPAFPAN